MRITLTALGVLIIGAATLSGCSTPPPGNVEMYPVLGPHPSFSQELSNEVNPPKATQSKAKKSYVRNLGAIESSSNNHSVSRPYRPLNFGY